MKKKLIRFSSQRQASLVGIMIWSAHWHAGQSSREYRMGCRARTLLERSNEIGEFLARTWFDKLENYVSDERGEIEPPRVYVLPFSKQAKKVYAALANISEKQEKKINPHY